MRGVVDRSGIAGLVLSFEAGAPLDRDVKGRLVRLGHRMLISPLNLLQLGPKAATLAFGNLRHVGVKPGGRPGPRGRLTLFVKLCAQASHLLRHGYVDRFTFGFSVVAHG